jgi:hypothetical protein
MTRDLMGRISAVLREDWLPGLSDRDYDRYAEMIVSLVSSGADVNAIAMRLESLEGDIIGRPTTDEHRLIVAGKLQQAAGQRPR